MNSPDPSEPTEAIPANEPPPQVPEATAPPATEPRTRRWWDPLWWRAHWLLPNLIPSQYGSDRDYERERDQKDNIHSRVPEQQQLRVHIVWGVELYGPSEIENLYAGLRNLGWGSIAWSDQKVVDWIQQQRSYGFGGWFNVGRVLRRKERGKSTFTQNFAPLPDQVESLIVRAIQISPSLTAMHIGFRLTESAARCYEEALNRNRVTYRKRSRRPGSISIVDVEPQKRQAVENVRADLRRLVGSWFDLHLPGFFASLERPRAFPTAELLMVENGPVLQEPADEPRSGHLSWRWLLGNTSPREVWTCTDSAGLQLSMDRRSNEKEGRHIVVALDAATFPLEKHGASRKRTPHYYTYTCDELLEGMLAHAATIEYLREQKRDLSITRENLKRARSSRRGVTRTLREIGLFFDRTLGSPATARELARESKQAGGYRHDCPAFTAPGWMKDDKPRDLSEEIRSTVHALATRLIEEEASIREHFQQLSTILSVQESIKAQRRMEWLTIAVLIVAFASLIVAVTPGERLVDRLNSLCDRVVPQAFSPK